jgi:hypothetical protein
MSAQKITRNVVVAVMLVAGSAALIPAPSIGVASVSASAKRGDLHVTKNCSEWHGNAGEFCTIRLSNLPEIEDARIFYDQAFGVPAGFLDSNVILYIGTGNWAVGRCTVDASNNFLGLCTFSDGVGALAGFTARVKVSPANDGDPADFNWDGTYSFSPRADR